MAVPDPLNELRSANYVCAGPSGIICSLPVSEDEDFILRLRLWFSWESDTSFGDDRASWHRRLYSELICGIWGANLDGLQ